MGLKQITFAFDDADNNLPGNEEAKKHKPAETGMPVDGEREVLEVNLVAEPEIVKSTKGRKKLKDMSPESSIPEIPGDDELFSKQYYSISKVAEMFHENISLIRYWENEFDILKPKKNGKGDRLFRPEDVKNLQLIYHLLRDKKYTIEGARDFLKRSGQADARFAAIESLKNLKLFLLELKNNL